MDTQKDKEIQASNGNSLIVSNKNVDPISFFEKDQSFVFVYKKTEKLATALYMVTNLFSDNEPMKWTLRKKVSDLLSYTVGYKDVASLQMSDFTHEVKSRVLEIVSLLDISSRSGLVSPMNFSILKQEFMNLISVLETSRETQGSAVRTQLSKTFFDVAKLPQVANETEGRAPQTVSSEMMSDRFITDNVRPSPIKDTGLPRHTDRQRMILELLQKKSELTIKDISQVIRNCSEKTIQRELIALIASGVLKKTGERRWSKYSLA